MRSVFPRRALCLAALASGTLVSCGGENGSGPAPFEVASPQRDRDQRTARASTAQVHDRQEGALLIRSGGSVESYLGGMRAVVFDSEGMVAGGAEQEFDGSARAQALELSLVLPAGEGYALSLSVRTTDAAPTTCRANVGPLQIVADALATVQVRAWDCGPTSAYVPTSAEPDSCFWLGDWSFVARSHARVGDDIAVGAAGRDMEGKAVSLAWSTAAPGFGRFADPLAARTSFRCEAAGQEQPLIVTMRDGACRKQLAHLVSCL